ncbi:MAG: hypothetical protein IKS34_00270, partial [Clostridia bacterium]|nr:hypothetical protein [Clostridia bacterium]
MTDRNDSRFFRVILLAAVLLLCAAGCVRSESARPEGIPVMLVETEGLHVTGENPVRAVNGADVSFRYELDSGYMVIDVPEGVTLDEKTNTVTVASPKYPRSVVLNVRRDPKQVRFFIENAGRGGRISADHKQGTLYEGTVITVQTELFDDVRFNGWSLNKTLSGGGRLVSDDLTYTFTLEENTTLYANYVSDTPSEQKENVRLILYNANGGQAKDGTPYYWQEADVTDFKSPNCL